MITTVNKQVAIRVFSTNTEEKDQSYKGLSMPDRLTSKLIKSSVVFNSESYREGDTLYFRSDILKLPYTMHKLQIGDVVFIMVPESEVMACEKLVKLPSRDC